LVEVLGGLALVFLSHEVIVRIATALTRAELVEDPRDLLAKALRQAAEGVSADAQSFAAWYLFSHGMIKLVLVLAVLANRVWAYPVFILAMIGFILYQVYRMTFDVTPVLGVITVLDLIVLFLAWHEYGGRSRTQMQAGPVPMNRLRGMGRQRIPKSCGVRGGDGRPAVAGRLACRHLLCWLHNPHHVLSRGCGDDDRPAHAGALAE
jgi:uncharacterized membrane protein